MASHRRPLTSSTATLKTPLLQGALLLLNAPLGWALAMWLPVPTLGVAFALIWGLGLGALLSYLGHRDRAGAHQRRPRAPRAQRRDAPRRSEPTRPPHKTDEAPALEAPPSDAQPTRDAPAGAPNLDALLDVPAEPTPAPEAIEPTTPPEQEPTPAPLDFGATPAPEDASPEEPSPTEGELAPTGEELAPAGATREPVTCEISGSSVVSELPAEAIEPVTAPEAARAEETLATPTDTATLEPLGDERAGDSPHERETLEDERPALIAQRSSQEVLARPLDTPSDWAARQTPMVEFDPEPEPAPQPAADPYATQPIDADLIARLEAAERPTHQLEDVSGMLATMGIDPSQVVRFDEGDGDDEREDAGELDEGAGDDESTSRLTNVSELMAQFERELEASPDAPRHPTQPIDWSHHELPER